MYTTTLVIHRDKQLLINTEHEKRLKINYNSVTISKTQYHTRHSLNVFNYNAKILVLNFAARSVVDFLRSRFENYKTIASEIQN